MTIAPQLERVGQVRDSSPVTDHPAGARHSLRVHIEELVLHGFAPGDRRGIAQAVETELTRLLGSGGARWAQSPPALERINGGAFKVELGSKPQATGKQVAQAVYRSLRQSSALSRRQGVRTVAAGKAGLGVR